MYLVSGNWCVTCVLRLARWSLLIAAVLLCPASFSSAADPFSESEILKVMQRANQYTVDNPYRESDRNWVRATWYSGVMEAYHATGDVEYLNQAGQWAEKHQWRLGEERSGFNRLFCAMTWAELYLLDPDPKKTTPTIDGLGADLPYAPEVGKVWYGHAPNPTDIERVYADALYAAPMFAMLNKATGDDKYLDYLNDAFWTVTDKILDENEDLYYRDPSYIGQESPNGKKIFWSRGNGWVFAGLPRVLKHLPKDAPNYDRYVDLYRRMAKSLASRQGDDGFWRANLDDPWHYTMPESSGTAFFTAGYAWGVREGILDQATYLPVIIRGWNALVSAIHPNGRLGWVQPIDAQPRPSHPQSTQEYAVGPLLTAGGQVYLLVRDGVITPSKIKAAILKQSEMLPPSAIKSDQLVARDHPLNKQINEFQKHQPSQDFTPTNLTRKDYLDVIAGQVLVMRQYQDDDGRIIDPVEGVEKYFTTPCYAHSVAVLAKAGYPIANDVVESGMKALDVALDDMANAKAAGGHGDFFTWPIVLAFELFDKTASQQRKDTWSTSLGQIVPESAYNVYRKPIDPSDHRGFYQTYGSDFANNWNLVNVAGEWGRVQHGFADPWYVDYCLTMQLANFSSFGMYSEHGDPLPYDLFSRHYLAGMLQRGYRSFAYTTYRDILWRGAWTSLFMQSPFGELPTGYRSSQHVWNEAEQAVIFEIYASAYAKVGRVTEAGAFKRAARLSLSSIKNWIRPDGSGYIVKNRYPIQAKHGYETYSVHTCYNMLACSMLAQAWQFAEDGIAEKPCPADVGGFVFEIPNFHKVFANAGGTYLEYDISGDQKYNPTGLLRIHLKDGNPQLGPSDGCAAFYSGKDQLFAVGPAWKSADGDWIKLAELTGQEPTVEVLDATVDQVRFKVSYRLDQNASGTFVGVTQANTVALNGTASWYSTGAAEIGKWFQRTFNGHDIYEVQSRTGMNSGCELKTTISGLKPNQQYAVGAVSGFRDDERWQVLCGLTPNKTDAVLSRGMTELTGDVARRSFYHPLIHQGRKPMGTAQASADGTIDVYTFIPADLVNSKRCWLAGFTCESVDSNANTNADRTVTASETFTVTPDEVLVENSVQGAGVSQLRIDYPMLVFDGEKKTDIQMDRHSVSLKLGGKGVRFEMLKPTDTELVRSGQKLNHRNGIVELLNCDVKGTTARYRIAPIRP
ncbi:Unsaturated rhamnogalacturonyl hydrolase YesR [Planctomycetes bacterium CA13]|uniref:Unsaturated rhamnogalacturonyl hydrolase YesR n=1 Tax=Novipirellula herctigrandis TaxID=2527986 RepID=A0A5C5Z095_9BACT|nr:Unsaturated rhamnogalacturonyl hydrolase YesR [Planctomycetes bacterium CA13]